MAMACWHGLFGNPSAQVQNQVSAVNLRLKYCLFSNSRLFNNSLFGIF